MNVSNDDGKEKDVDHSFYLYRRSSIKVSPLSLFDEGHLDPRGGTSKLFGVRTYHEEKKKSISWAIVTNSNM